ncbi:MAG: hypothetical protein J6T08_05110 [Lentisphaeria bacterium]|nr:hypothetical protein [Lentisphaeria bacterium]
MPKRIANTQLNGRTIDILNVIRTNASYAYQQSVPAISDAQGIPRVGEVLYGNPTLANEFINALVNRIALVVVNSATFNNPYADLKKGYIEYGETVEDIFTAIIKAVEFNPEKAGGREFKRNLPDVKTAFHTMNWRAMYPITIQREDLRRAFLSADGVENMITSILDQIYVSAEYDEFLLFKYMLIKAIAAGKAYPVAFDATTPKAGAIVFRQYSNMLPFMKTLYNEAGVTTNTPKERQQIFMDAAYNATFDVEVLAGAFNMDKADFIGRLRLIDDFTTFDNARFDVIRANSDQLEEVTDAELTLMADVKAVLVDEKWFQVYDNENVMTDTPVASGLYWNYFYHTWKTVSHSPFANIVVFVDDGATVTAPASLTFKVAGVVKSDISTVINLEHVEGDTLQDTNYNFVQDSTSTAAGVAIHPYGSIIAPITMSGTPAAEVNVAITPKLTINGVGYTASAAINTVTDAGSGTTAVAVGDTVTMAKDV